MNGDRKRKASINPSTPNKKKERKEKNDNIENKENNFKNSNVNNTLIALMKDTTSCDICCSSTHKTKLQNPSFVLV